MPGQAPSKTISRPKIIWICLIIVIIGVLIIGTLNWYVFMRGQNKSSSTNATNVATSSATSNKKTTNLKNSSPSEEMSTEFKAVLNKEYLTILTTIDTSIKDYEKRQNLTNEETTDIQEAKQILESIEGKTLKEKADTLTADTVARWGGAFVVSTTEVEKFLADEYNDAENKSLVKNYISEFATRNAAMPLLFKYLISEYQSGELNSGIRLELTKRLLEEYLKEIS